MRELTCIGCPLGCQLTVQMESGGISVSGNTCPRGAKYAKNEITCPKRMVTSTVRITGGEIARLSVKTETEIPKEKMTACMQEIHRVCVAAPISRGSVIIENCAGSGVNIIATKDVRAR